jgi:nickel superoxide dismutase
MKLRFALLGALLSLLLVSSLAWSHCQVPCGIYDDAARIQSMREDATTIEKAMNSIVELAAKSDALSANQLTRWIMTKEDHASKVITVVSEYFLTQKLKPVAAGEDGYDVYLGKLADHHAVMRAAMICKQTVDPANVATLRAAIEKLAEDYDVAEHEH